MSSHDALKIGQQAGDLVKQGFHWSEAIMLAVGEHLLGKVDDQTVRMTTAMGGGVGLTLQELCGALSSGVLLIGALHGRSTSEEDDNQCAQIASRYRQSFLGEFGSTRCQDIRNRGFGKDGKWPCSELVERAAGILLETLPAS